jgi:hypothetical protein
MQNRQADCGGNRVLCTVDGLILIPGTILFGFSLIEGKSHFPGHQSDQCRDKPVDAAGNRSDQGPAFLLLSIHSSLSFGFSLAN